MINKKAIIIAVCFLILIQITGYFPAFINSTSEEKIIHAVFSSLAPTKTQIYILNEELLNTQISNHNDTIFILLERNQLEPETSLRNGTWFYYYKIDHIKLLTSKYGRVQITKYCLRTFENVIETGACGTYRFDISKKGHEWVSINTMVIVN